MAFANTALVWQLTMSFEGNKAGWQEKLYLTSGDVATALTAANDLVNYRLALLPSVYNMVFAKISKVGSPRDRRAVASNFPLPGAWPGELSGTPPVAAAGTLTSNSDKDAIAYQIETADGSWTTRYLHGIPDKYYSADLITSAITEAGAAPPAIDDVSFSTNWFTVAGYYYYKVRHSTVMFRQRFNGAQTLLQTDTIAAIFTRKATQHKVGRVFGEERGRAVPR